MPNDKVMRRLCNWAEWLMAAAGRGRWSSALSMCLSAACHHNGHKQYGSQINFASFLLFFGSTLTHLTSQGNQMTTWGNLELGGGAEVSSCWEPGTVLRGLRSITKFSSMTTL